MSDRQAHRLRVLIAVGVVLCAAWMSWTAFSRSLIPVELEGTVKHIQWYTDSGFRLRILHLTNGDEHVVDTPIATQLQVGDIVEKSRGEDVLQSTGGTVILVPSDETWQLPLAAILLPGAAFSAVSLVHRSRRTTSA